MTVEVDILLKLTKMFFLSSRKTGWSSTEKLFTVVNFSTVCSFSYYPQGKLNHTCWLLLPRMKISFFFKAFSPFIENRLISHIIYSDSGFASLYSSQFYFILLLALQACLVPERQKRSGSGWGGGWLVKNWEAFK